ncbi:hypothetical protein [Geosporobacter ferrireducens]|uniref:hypothetical protein n=1 Tax=Geosporobacter ferrireducens TaxID=1424294 RepID=UPI00139CDBAC|nr:hypothetical protein [Geosporobacter ferrireducens]MTI57282.1 hypothetical protein [Geosporobacter ferrireducens]
MTINNIRVKVSKKYSNIYKELISEQVLHSKIFDSHGDIFTLCCALGYKYNECKPLEKGEPLFFSHYFTKENEVAIRAIVVAATDKNYMILEEEKEKELISIAEQYAEGGMQILIKNVLSPFLLENDEDYVLSFNKDSYVEKELLSFIYNEYTKAPF